MPLDPRIAMGFQAPQFESPVNMMGNMMKLKSMQQQNALAEQQMADLATERARVGAMNEAYKGAYNPETGELNYSTIAGGLAKAGQGAAIPSVLKTRDEGLKARYDSLESFNRALTHEGAVFKSQLQQLNPSDRNAPAIMAQYILGHHAPGSLTAELLKRQGITPEQSLSALNNAVKTGTFADFYARSVFGAEEFIKRNTMTANEQSMKTDRAAVRTETGRHNFAMEGIQSQQEARQGTPDPIKLRREATTLRKEFDTLPEVKDFKAALPVLMSARNAPDTAAGDIDLAYAVGKIYDPKSVVRESEQKLVYTTGSVLQKLIGGANVALTGGTRLPSEVRQKLLNALNNRVLQFRQAYDQTRGTYEGYANQSGFDPVNVIGQHPASAYKGQSNAVVQVKTDADFDKLPSGTLFVGPDGEQRRKP